MLRRRSLLAAAASAPLAACAPRRGAARAIIVGAGVFGAWTAEHLQRAGWHVTLVDQAGPANARASSGGESRMTRSSYGADAIYTRMALASLEEWKALSRRTSLPLFHQSGVLFLFDSMVDYARDSIAVHRDLSLPLEQIDPTELARRWPQFDLAGIEFGLYEPEFGALMARRAVQETVARLLGQGGTYLQAFAEPGEAAASVRLDGKTHRADAVIYACGPWLPKVFPELLGQRIFVTRQEIAFIAPPFGDERFVPDALPGWADFNGGDLYYGFPDLEGRGFKIARDQHGAPFDPDTGDRRISDEGLALLRAFAARRFPALVSQPFNEARVCQYENSSNGDFLIDRHPDRPGDFLLGGGSGHGFKHGPEVGRLMGLLVSESETPDPRFSLSSKGTVQAREVL